MRHYTCHKCGGDDIEFAYPCWVKVNSTEDITPEVDWEAAPLYDAFWCATCGENFPLSRVIEVNDETV